MIWHTSLKHIDTHFISCIKNYYLNIQLLNETSILFLFIFPNKSYQSLAIIIEEEPV